MQEHMPNSLIFIIFSLKDMLTKFFFWGVWLEVFHVAYAD